MNAWAIRVEVKAVSVGTDRDEVRHVTEVCMSVGSSNNLATPAGPGFVETSTYLTQWAVDSDYAQTAHWIIVERDVEAGERHLLVGPYRGARSAYEAMIDSLLLDSLAEESCLDMYAVPHTGLDPIEVSSYEIVLVDEHDPAHHARSRGPWSM